MTGRSRFRSANDPNASRDRLVCIGIFLGPGPASGGTYQYILSIIEALLTLPDTRYRLVAFFEDPAWKTSLSVRFEQRHCPRRFLLTIAGKILRDLLGLSNFSRIARFFYASIRAMDQSSCQLIIYPGQDPQSYYSRKPALVAIHDLMHRYARHFDEYSHGNFDFRETHYRLIVERAAGILVDSELGKRQVAECYGAPLTKIFTLPFVPPRYIFEECEDDVDALYSLPKRFLYYPAQFWEHKNHKNLVSALTILRNQGLRVDLVLSGGKKNAYESTVRLIHSSGLQGQVHILGYVPDRHMASIYKRADAMVFASLIGPTNIPPLEAMALGCPLICSDAFAMPEQVKTGGLLVDASNPDALAAVIADVWGNRKLRAALSRKGLQRSRFWQQPQFNQRFGDILSNMLGSAQN